jgi:hypothetical protein
MENKKTPIDWLMEQITYDDGGRRLASWIESVDLKPYFDEAQQMYYQELLQSNIEEVADYVRPKEDTPVEIVYVKETDWYPAKQINFFDLGNSLEIVYKEECEKIHLERVFKIVYSCIDGKWNKSEPIYASRINGKYNFINK